MGYEFIDKKRVGMPKQSPYKTRISHMELSKTCQKYTKVMGKVVGIQLSEAAGLGKAALVFNVNTPSESHTQFMPNWQLKFYMEYVIKQAGVINKAFLTPAGAVKPTTFKPNPELLNRENFSKVVDSCSQMLLYNLLSITYDEIHLICAGLGVRKCAKYLNLATKIQRYLSAHDFFHKWSYPNAVKNIRALLKREYLVVFSALNREARDGHKVIPPKYNIRIAA